jgi:hypothetical protein
VASSHSQIGRLVIYSQGIMDGEFPPKKRFEHHEWFLFQLEGWYSSGTRIKVLPGSCYCVHFLNDVLKWQWEQEAIGQFPTRNCIIDDGTNDMRAAVHFVSTYNQLMVV